MSKKITKISLISLLVLIIPSAIAIIIITLITLLLTYREPEFTRSSSPSNKYYITLHGSGGLIGSSSRIEAYQNINKQASTQNQKNEKLILKTTLRNDGKNPSSGDASFKWINDNQVFLKLDAEEQESECFQIQLGEKPKYQQINCSQVKFSTLFQEITGSREKRK
ncbi:MAG: hypothetical protein ACFB02_17065 [Mastigocoleus sp.]